jgi:hypothetical protein
MKTRNVILILVAAIGGAFVCCLGLCGLGGFYLYRTASAEISPRVDEVIASITADPAASYANDTTPELRKVTTQEQYKNLGKFIETKFGRLQSKTMTGCNMRNINGRSYADATFNAQFEKAKGTIIARLEKISGRWQVSGLNVSSPDIKLQCPACGADYPFGAKFCPKCGKALD